MDSNNSFSDAANFSSAANTTSSTFDTVRQTSSPFVTSWSAYLMSVVQWVIFVLGTIGNLTIVAVLIWKRSKSQLVTQIFVGSLSVAGLALMFSSGWIYAIVFFENSWRFGQNTCQALTYLQSVAINASMCTLAAHSVERYLGISKPTNRSVLKVSWAVAITVLIWTASLLILIPMYLWSSVTTVDRQTGRLSCNTNNAPQQMRTSFILFSRLFIYWIPLAITWICYVGIIVKTTSSVQKVSGVVSTAASQASAAAMSKVTLMCVAIATSITLTTLPFTSGLYVLAFGDRSMIVETSLLLPYLRAILMVNTCINPIVYGVMWRPIRTSLQNVGVFTFL